MRSHTDCDLSDVPTEGMLCYVELFAVPTTAVEGQDISLPPIAAIAADGFDFDMQEDPEPGDALALSSDYPNRRQAQRTSELSGNRYVEAVKIEYQGKKRIVFPFPVRVYYATTTIRAHRVSPR